MVATTKETRKEPTSGQGEFVLLPVYKICQICRYHLSDVCEPCMVNREFSWFKIKDRVDLEDIPIIRSEEFASMPARLRSVYVGICLEKIMERIQVR